MAQKGKPVELGSELELKGQIKVDNDDAGNWIREEVPNAHTVEGTFFYRIGESNWREACTEEYSSTPSPNWTKEKRFRECVTGV